MADSLLQIINDGLGEMGLPQFDSIVGNVDPTAVQCLALMQAVGEDLLDEEGGWPQLEGMQTIELVAGQESYGFPGDISMYLDGGAWDTQRRWRVINTTAREWMALRYGLIANGPWFRFRLFDGQIHFNPVPSDTGEIAIAYYRNGFCASSNGTAQTRWLKDDDVPLLPKRLFKLGLKWRLLAAKGMNYSEERANYDDAVPIAKSRSKGAAVLDMGRRAPRFINFGDPQIPSGDWPAQ